jgi:calcineurin-like phosphoesterase family protein
MAVPSMSDLVHTTGKDTNIFFTSDSHFGHENIIKYCNRPFGDASEMDEHLVKVWNDKVPKDGLVYHIGDVCFGGQPYIDRLMNRLNGEKILIIGNHDKESALSKHFSKVYRLASVTVGNTKLVLCHYPIESWPGLNRGVVHLHGHCHGNLPNIIRNRMDVGVDCHYNYEPFSLVEILQNLKTRDLNKTQESGERHVDSDSK